MQGIQQTRASPQDRVQTSTNPPQSFIIEFASDGIDRRPLSEKVVRNTRSSIIIIDRGWINADMIALIVAGSVTGISHATEQIRIYLFYHP